MQKNNKKVYKTLIHFLRYTLDCLKEDFWLSFFILLISELQFFALIFEQLFNFIDPQIKYISSYFESIWTFTKVFNLKDSITYDSNNTGFQLTFYLSTSYLIFLMILIPSLFHRSNFRKTNKIMISSLWGLICLIHEKILFMPIYGFFLVGVSYRILNDTCEICLS